MTLLRLATNDGPYRSAREEPGQRIAAIDIGSNSIRQIVADVSANGAIRVVDEMKAAPRLGSGLDHDGALGAEPMRLALESLARMATLARQLGAKRIEAVATSAVRDAQNGAAFLTRVRQETGLRVRLLDGEEEARLAFRSALAHFELGAVRAVVMDIGGGWTRRATRLAPVRCTAAHRTFPRCGTNGQARAQVAEAYSRRHREGAPAA